MGSTSVSGTGCAAPTGDWARSAGRWRRIALIAGALALLPGAAPLASLDLSIAGLRSARGLVRVCVTADPRSFPQCDRDPAARRLSVPAAQGGTMRFEAMATGSYAVALFHDENGNGRIDRRMGIPTEGVGFSNNPPLWFGPPSFTAARIAVAASPTDETVRLRYFF